MLRRRKIPDLVAVVTGKDDSDVALLGDMARERVEDDLGVGSARREEEELVLGDLRCAVIEVLTAQAEALGVREPVVDGDLRRKPLRQRRVRTRAGEAGIDPEVLHERGDRGRVVARGDGRERRKAVAPARTAVVLGERREDPAQPCEVLLVRRKGLAVPVRLDRDPPILDDKAIVIELEGGIDVGVDQVEAPLVAANPQENREALDVVVVRRIELCAEEREQQRQAVRHDQTMRVLRPKKAIGDGNRRREVQPSALLPDATPKEVLALVEGAILEGGVPDALDRPVGVRFDAVAVADGARIRRKVDLGDPGKLRQAGNAFVHKRHDRSRNGTRMDSSVHSPEVRPEKLRPENADDSGESRIGVASFFLR